MKVLTQYVKYGVRRKNVFSIFGTWKPQLDFVTFRWITKTLIVSGHAVYVLAIGSDIYHPAICLYSKPLVLWYQNQAGRLIGFSKYLVPYMILASDDS